ncbi:MAG: hypothetical protein KatS3mg111_1464 [Pirellulaceae bacterium]|nr:MAG: hypothetical protein KatS3mg111_1464 [Pirellulaceae bacterium]
MRLTLAIFAILLSAIMAAEVLGFDSGSDCELKFLAGLERIAEQRQQIRAYHIVAENRRFIVNGESERLAGTASYEFWFWRDRKDNEYRRSRVRVYGSQGQLFSDVELLITPHVAIKYDHGIGVPKDPLPRGALRGQDADFAEISEHYIEPRLVGLRPNSLSVQRDMLQSVIDEVKELRSAASSRSDSGGAPKGCEYEDVVGETGRILRFTYGKAADDGPGSTNTIRVFEYAIDQGGLPVRIAEFKANGDMLDNWTFVNEIRDGIWFPIRVEKREFAKSSTEIERTTFSVLEFNRPMDPGLFDLSVLLGTDGEELLLISPTRPGKVVARWDVSAQQGHWPMGALVGASDLLGSIEEGERDDSAGRAADAS